MKSLPIENDAWDDALFNKGNIYTVGTNDGAHFKQVEFIGTKLYHGKSMMVFKTNDERRLTINPSYQSFVIEDPYKPQSFTGDLDTDATLEAEIINNEGVMP